jgi:hypothetical protein
MSSITYTLRFNICVPFVTDHYEKISFSVTRRGNSIQLNSSHCCSQIHSPLLGDKVDCCIELSYRPACLCSHYTVRKMDLILRSIERMLQTQLSMARRFKLQVLRRYDVKFYKMHNFTLDTQSLHKS